MQRVAAENWQPFGIEDLELNAWQALQTAESVSVVAGAGAGKTEFLAQKASFLLQTGKCPSPKRILAISFKRDAARNLKARVEKRCPAEQARRFDSSTFDAFAKGLLDRFRLALPKPFYPSTNYQIFFPTRPHFEAFIERKDMRQFNAQELQKAISRKSLPIDGDTAMDQLVREYWQEQLEDNDESILSFAMINRLVVFLLVENPMIKRAIQQTYPFVFLDEFQDTTSEQFELLRICFECRDREKIILTAVGDDKQRIMAWAGAMPDAFSHFQNIFGAKSVPLVCNWRSHPELVLIQQVIAKQIDPNTAQIEARAAKNVSGDVAAIWEFSNRDEEAKSLAEWIAQEVELGELYPHDIALLVRMRADQAEQELSLALAEYGLRIRNEARDLGGISIQDVLGENLTEIFLSMLRLGSSHQDPESWCNMQDYLCFLNGVNPSDEAQQRKVQDDLSEFLLRLRSKMTSNLPERENAKEIAELILSFISEDKLRQVFSSYRRQVDFNRVWDGFCKLFLECAERSKSWIETVEEFIGLGQVPLMTIHKSKGLEFHTIIFLGLDNQSWWSLTVNRPEELNAFFVAFSRAEQRAFFTTCSERGRPVTWLEQLLEPAGMQRA